MSKRPTATILKLIRGDPHTARLKDDKPKIDGKPQLPPGLVLSPAEHTMFNWLLDHVYVQGIHGTGDGPAFAKIARLWVRVNDADAKVQAFGMVMKSPRTGKPELQPYARLSRDLWQQLGIALAEVGATPAGRVKLAGPRGSELPGEPTSWDDIE
jgi:hypothetical protein